MCKSFILAGVFRGLQRGAFCKRCRLADQRTLQKGAEQNRRKHKEKKRRS